MSVLLRFYFGEYGLANIYGRNFSPQSQAPKNFRMAHPSQFYGMKHKVMSENQYLSNLIDLDLSCARISNMGLNHIVSSPHFTQLKYQCLSIEDIYIDDNGCKILAESENVRNVTSLKLSVKHVGHVTLDGLSYIFNSNNLCNIQLLVLKGSKLKGLDSNDNSFGDLLMKSSFRNNLKSYLIAVLMHWVFNMLYNWMD